MSADSALPFHEALETSSLPRMPRSELLTVDQAAKRLNVPVGYVRRRLIFERRIPYVKIGRHVRIESAVVEALIEAGRVEVGEVARASGRRRRSVEEIREEEASKMAHIRKHPVTGRPQVRWVNRLSVIPACYPKPHG